MSVPKVSKNRDRPRPFNLTAGTVGLFIGVLPVAFVFPALIGRIDQATAIHSAEGVPIVLTAVGALAVAIGLFSRLFEGFPEANIGSAERRLWRVLNSPPPASNIALTAQHTRDVEDIEADIAQQSFWLGVWRSFSAGAELSGAIVLAFGAATGIWAWSVTS